MSQAPRNGLGGVSVAFAIALSLVLVGTIALFGIAYVNQLRTQMVHERFVAPPNEKLQKTVATQEEMLTRRGWVDESAGIARIPIEDAMRWVVAREAAKAEEAGEAGGGS